MWFARRKAKADAPWRQAFSIEVTVHDGEGAKTWRFADAKIIVDDIPGLAGDRNVMFTVQGAVESSAYDIDPLRPGGPDPFERGNRWTALWGEEKAAWRGRMAELGHPPIV